MQFKILVINKDAKYIEKLTSFLGNYSHHVHIVNSGEEGINYIELNKPNLVLVDEMLSEYNAQDFIIKASQRKIFTHSAFLLTTERPLDEINKIRFMSLGFSYFLTKDFEKQSQDSLINIIEDEIKMLPFLSVA